MTTLSSDSVSKDLQAYLSVLSQVLLQPEHKAPFAAYALGLLSPLPRKSVEPIAALHCSHPSEVSAKHQHFLHFLGNAKWSDEQIRLTAARYALSHLEKEAPIEVSIIDDTGFLKQGKHSVGVKRQYTGSAGKVTPCQVAVSLTLCTKNAHLPVDMQLYLPTEWVQEEQKRKASKIPHEVTFQTKHKLALGMLTKAKEAGLPLGVVLADAGYGDGDDFREGISALSARSKPNQGRLWLVIEETKEKQTPYKYYLSNLPKSTKPNQLVYLCKARWRTEQMYREMKQELGLDHYEGRGYPGWHHHVSAVLCTYAFVLSQREGAFPPCNEKSGTDEKKRTKNATTSGRFHRYGVPSVISGAASLASHLSHLPTRGSPTSRSASRKRKTQSEGNMTQ